MRSPLLHTMDAIRLLRGKLHEDRMSEEARCRANNTIIQLAEDISTTDIIRLLVAYRELTLGIREALKIADKHLHEARTRDDWVPEAALKQFLYRVNMLLNSSVQITGSAGGSHGPQDV